MKQHTLIPLEVIEKKIFLIRGQKVMIGPDLAGLYGLETRVLMQAVKRNLVRFPADFMFVLSREEIRRISHIVTSLKFSKTVYSFTEEGVAMLSGVLNSPRAIQMNIAIMRAFVRLREILSTHKDLARKLEELEKKYDGQFRVVFEAIRQLMIPPEPPKRRIGFRVDEPKIKYCTTI
jgi:hypothetical protein